jgi:putative transposase
VPTHEPGHLRTFDYLGPYAYFLTFCCDARRRIFVDTAVVDLVLEQILRAASDERFAVVAYCFMPDHAHLLIEGQSDVSDCLRFIARAKQRSAFHYGRADQGRLWQRYGYEHVLRSDEDTRKVARYIFENPLRARFVCRPEDYRFMGSCVYSVEEVLEYTGATSG